MSFGNFARKVRDTSLPYGRRVLALRSCVQLYRPIGFEATLSYLAELAGPYDRDEVALLGALDALIASRTAWHHAIEEYAAARRQAKKAGRRRPRPDEPNPYVATQWYGAPRAGALHALDFWRLRRLPEMVESGDPTAVEANRIVVACLASDGRLDAEGEASLEASLAALADSLTQRPHRQLYLADSAAYDRIRRLFFLIRLVRTAAGLKVTAAHR